jgi:hypothetical protein
MAQSLKEPKASAPAASSGSPQPVRFEDDYCAWVEQQVALLREGRLDAIDVENIAEELADMGTSERVRVESALKVLIMHMLKWDQQPEKHSRSSAFTIAEQRRRISKWMRQSPSLKRRVDEMVADGYANARAWAAYEALLPEEDFPRDCPYSWDDIMTRPFATDDQA